MSLEILDQLEEKIRQAVETIQLLQLEVEELKEQKNQSQQAVEALQHEMSNLEMNTATGKNTFVHCWVNSTTYNDYKGLENLSLFSY